MYRFPHDPAEPRTARGHWLGMLVLAGAVSAAWRNPRVRRRRHKDFKFIARLGEFQLGEVDARFARDEPGPQEHAL